MMFISVKHHDQMAVLKHILRIIITLEDSSRV